MYFLKYYSEMNTKSYLAKMRHVLPAPDNYVLRMVN